MQMLYVSVLCASCGSSQSQCCILHDLQFVMLLEDARGILQSRAHDSVIGSHKCLLLFTHPVAVSDFINCSGMCACTEMV